MVVAVGVLAGSMNAFAASYVTGNIPNHGSIVCTGSMGFTNQTLTASTGCNQTLNLKYQTSITGALKSGSKVLETQTCTTSLSSNATSRKASIYNSVATGYSWGNGTHKVAYLSTYVWSDYTNM